MTTLNELYAAGWRYINHEKRLEGLIITLQRNGDTLRIIEPWIRDPVNSSYRSNDIMEHVEGM